MKRASRIFYIIYGYYGESKNVFWGDAVLQIPIWLDLAAVIIGAVSGLWAAQERKLDLIGHIGLSFLGGLGGGLLRDAAMQVGSVYMLQSPYPITIVLMVGVMGFCFPQIIRQHPNLLEWLDILSVGLFVVPGTDKAMVYRLYPMACLLMGIFTGVGGGMLRDIFLGDTPRIFQRSNFYATAATGGALAYFLLVGGLWVNQNIAAVISVATTIGLRRASLHYNVLSPAELDLTPLVKNAGKKITRYVRRKK